MGVGGGGCTPHGQAPVCLEAPPRAAARTRRAAAGGAPPHGASAPLRQQPAHLAQRAHAVADITRNALDVELHAAWCARPKPHPSVGGATTTCTGIAADAGNAAAAVACAPAARSPHSRGARSCHASPRMPPPARTCWLVDRATVTRSATMLHRKPVPSGWTGRRGWARMIWRLSMRLGKYCLW